MGGKLDKYASKPISYFGHDADAASDIKCKRLIKKMGWAGYGRWWRLCEVLAGTNGHALPTRYDEDWEILADYLDFDDVDSARQFIETLRSLTLIEADADFVWSKRMHQNAEAIGKRRLGAAMTNAKRKVK